MMSREEKEARSSSCPPNGLASFKCSHQRCVVLGLAIFADCLSSPQRLDLLAVFDPLFVSRAAAKQKAKRYINSG
jgi:hypothetical protein